MSLSRRFWRLGVWIAVILGSASRASASVTWHYHGTIMSPCCVFSNGTTFSEPPFLLPAPLPISMDITFDPNTPASFLDQEGDYLLSGGDTSLRIQIDDHVSTLVDKFSMSVMAVPDDEGQFIPIASRIRQDLVAGTRNSVLLAGYDSSGVGIDFPGYLEGGQIYAGFFAPRIVPNALPTVQPPPSLYPVGMTFGGYIAQNVPPGFNPQVTLIAEFTSIPEPSGFMLILLSLPTVAVCGRWRPRRSVD
jgi:hypothetical protein